MAANTLKVVYTTSDKLSGLTLAPGQLYFLEDIRAIQFVNKDGDLVNYQSVVSLPTDAGRIALSHPYPALYWVKDTNILWRYEDEWYQITNPPKEQIVFDYMPEVGSANTIYVDGDTMYRYIDGKYQPISGDELNWLPLTD